MPSPSSPSPYEGQGAQTLLPFGQPASSPPQGASSPSTDTLARVLQEMRTQLDQLRLRINSLNIDAKGPDLKVRWPSQQVAGIIEFPDLLPYPFFFGLQELTEQAGSGTASFGTTGNDAFTTIALNTVYTYITHIGLFAYRETAPQDSGLGTGFWLPHTPGNAFANTDTTPYQGFDFLFGLRLQSDGISLQTNLIPSRVLAFNDSLMRLPLDFRMKTGDGFQITARPLRLALQGERIRLFVALWGYQMRDGKQMSKL